MLRPYSDETTPSVSDEVTGPLKKSPPKKQQRNKDKLPPLKPKKKTKKHSDAHDKSIQRIPSSSNSALGVEDSVHNIKKKKKKPLTQSQLSINSNVNPDPMLVSHIQDLVDDIVDSESPIHSSSESKNDTTRSSSKDFVQYSYGFKEVSKSELHEQWTKNTNICNVAVPMKTYMLAVSIALHSESFFLKFCSILHGMLAGLTLGHCLMVYFLGPVFFEMFDFVEHYAAMVYPFYAVFFVLQVFVLISALDRCDVGHSATSFFHSIAMCDPTAYLVLLYSLAMILTLVVLKTEDKFSLHWSWKSSVLPTELNGAYVLPSLNNSSSMLDEDEYYLWWSLIIARTVIDIICWMIICSLHPYCRLVERIKEQFKTETEPSIFHIT